MVNVQGIFFTLGVIFLFATLAYFSYEYLFQLSNVAKTIVLACIAVIFFVVGSILEGSDL